MDKPRGMALRAIAHCESEVEALDDQGEAYEFWRLLSEYAARQAGAYHPLDRLDRFEQDKKETIRQYLAGE